jgi:hypothetical protein
MRPEREGHKISTMAKTPVSSYTSKQGRPRPVHQPEPPTSTPGLQTCVVKPILSCQDPGIKLNEQRKKDEERKTTELFEILNR